MKLSHMLERINRYVRTSRDYHLPDNNRTHIQPKISNTKSDLYSNCNVKETVNHCGFDCENPQRTTIEGQIDRILSRSVIQDNSLNNLKSKQETYMVLTGISTKNWGRHSADTPDHPLEGFCSFTSICQEQISFWFVCRNCNKYKKLHIVKIITSFQIVLRSTIEKIASIKLAQRIRPSWKY